MKHMARKLDAVNTSWQGENRKNEENQNNDKFIVVHLSKQFSFKQSKAQN